MKAEENGSTKNLLRIEITEQRERKKRTKMFKVKKRKHNAREKLEE